MLCNEEFHSLYSSLNVIRMIKCTKLIWVSHVARMEQGTSAFKILTGKPTVKRPLERPREGNIRMDLKEICVSTRN